MHHRVPITRRAIMPRRVPSIKRPEIGLDATSPVPLYKQLYERVRGAILTGQLERGARLPSTRTLASELGVARMTTALAYQQLVLEGYLESRVGQGTVVAPSLPDTLFHEQTYGTLTEQAGAPKASTIHIASHARLLKEVPFPERVEGQTGGAFRGGEPALELFPYEVWARLIARCARQSLREFSHYQAPAGYYPLREAIAAHIGITRGVRCTPEQIILTAGSQGALDLAARAAQSR
jgi:GntR family transcriptional regulator/MocR family aminotransferase